MFNNTYIISENGNPYVKYFEYGFHNVYKKDTIVSIVDNDATIPVGKNIYIILADDIKSDFNEEGKYVFINDYGKDLYKKIPESNKITIKELPFDHKHLTELKENLFINPEEDNVFYTIFGSIYTPAQMLQHFLHRKKTPPTKEIVSLKNNMRIKGNLFSECDYIISAIDNYKSMISQYKSMLLITDDPYDIRLFTFMSLGLNIYSNETVEKKQFYGKAICYYKSTNKTSHSKIKTFNKKERKTNERYDFYEKIINYYNFTHIKSIITDF